MRVKEVDYLIVGQGLAGTILIYTLWKRGKKVHVFDKQEPNSSSMVAAGLYNPITGRKMVKTWNANKLFHLIAPFYEEIEKLIKARILYPLGIYRPFISHQEQNEWQGKSSEPSFAPYIKSLYSKPLFENVNNEYGGLALQYAGYVDIPALLIKFRDFLSDQELLSDENFITSELSFTSEGVTYRGIKAKKVVFCTGIKSVPYFEWLPFRPVKGEIIDIDYSGDLGTIINRGVFVIPKNRDTFRVGSTYNMKDLTTKVTEKGKEYLEDKLKALIKGEYFIKGERAGVRPATADRRPFIGNHPDLPQVGIFNGFGTKGVSLGPYYADQLFSYLEYGKELEAEVNISRYFSLI